ncbi:MAG: FHA domain-containing protein [Deltaproteobacteria bacterium]|nr:MAG: FHA domain-containing protein [Deltaproteobacteria bacterium]
MGPKKSKAGLFDSTMQIRVDADGTARPAEPGPTRATPLGPGPRPWLEIEGAAAEENTLMIAKPMVILGRSEGVVDLPIDDDGASRHHASIVHHQGRFVLHDLGSTNGTRVNGDPVTRHVLEDGDRIEIGETTLVFHRE